MITSRSNIMAGYVEGTVKKRSAYKVLVRKPEEKKYLEYLGVDGSIILKLLLKE
jgi:hypothetical protein